jgi:hypothetical protein
MHVQELSIFKITNPEQPHVDDTKYNLQSYADTYFRKTAQRDIRLVFTKVTINPIFEVFLINNARTQSMHPL